MADSAASSNHSSTPEHSTEGDLEADALLPDEQPQFEDSDSENAACPRDQPVSERAFMEIEGHFADSQAMAPINDIVTRATEAYLGEIDTKNPPVPRVVEGELLGLVNAVIRIENRKGSKSEGYPLLRVLLPWQIAKVMMACDHVVRLVVDESGDDEVIPLAIYQSSGVNRGTYSVNRNLISACAREYDPQIGSRGMTDVMATLAESAPKVEVCSNRDLIAVENGIVDYRTKTLRPFSPDVALLSKIGVEYDPSFSTSPVIVEPDRDDWEVETWMETVFPNADDRAFVWQLIGAAIRPNVRWGVSVFFYNTRGNNGKGTVLKLIRSLVGPKHWGTMPLADFDKQFRLAGIVGRTAFGADENDVGDYLEKIANFKCVVTNEPVKIERKGKDSYSYIPHGIVIQCVNEMPRVRDKTDSFYRRLIPLAFTQRFQGNEKKYIKDDYLTRPEVLKYVLWRVINMPDYYELEAPPSSQAVMDEYKVTNDPVREFWSEMESQFVWALLPKDFLYDLFVAWTHRTNPRSDALKRSKFYNDLKTIVTDEGSWDEGQFRISHWMDDPEPLIAEYDLKLWLTPGYTGSDPLKRSLPLLKERYSGLRRVGRGTARTAQLAAQNAQLIAQNDNLTPDNNEEN